jgi:hypothetical protein
LELDPQVVEMLNEAAREHETTVSEVSESLLVYAAKHLGAAEDEDFEFEDDEDFDDEDEDDEEFDDEDFDEDEDEDFDDEE